MQIARSEGLNRLTEREFEDYYQDIKKTLL